MKPNFYLMSILVGIFSLPVCFGSIAQTTPGVFVLGGIHQSHETAKYYTYERMGDIYQLLKPDILCVETEQKYVEDGSFRGTPYDFINFLIPLAQKEQTPIYGIDWWDNEQGEKWQELQRKAYNDTTLNQEINFIGGFFSLFNGYFKNKDFKEINSSYITRLWKAKSEFKYHIFNHYPEYAFITDFENERNDHIVENILKVIAQNSGKNILIAIGIDHKYYIEDKLEENGVIVYQVEELEQFAE
ncbi:MAG: hypothetical protein PHW91_00695 [Bacteroidales bacterium]|jgi:hypothetical protein|nr:hypothetical protein [Bacteroidales bacterium]